MYSKLLLVFLLSCKFLEAVQLLEGIQKCKKFDEECMKKSIVGALKVFEDVLGAEVFGFLPMRPFTISKLRFSGSSDRPVYMQQTYRNVKLHGFTDVEVKKYRLFDDGKTCRWELTSYNPYLRMEAFFIVRGQIMIFPIDGYGHCNVTLNGLTVRHTADCEHYMKEGKSFIRIKNYKMDMSVEKCRYTYPNLIPDSEKISKMMEDLLNENSLAIFKDVKGDFEEILANIYEKGSNIVFSMVPENELFLPE